MNNFSMKIKKKYLLFIIYGSLFFFPVLIIL
jgi:hypothetical protein